MGRCLHAVSLTGLALMAIGGMLSCRPIPAPESTATPSPTRPPTFRETTLFEALDLDIPGLRAVKAAVRAADFDTATQELATYYRERTQPAWRVDPGRKPRGFDQVKADAAAEGRLVGGLVPIEHAFPGGKVDWLYNATSHVPGQAFNPEWQWQLNRMAFWWDLGNAYRTTQDEKYAAAFASQMRSWVTDCPVPPEIQKTGLTAWRTIEAGIRMNGSWPDAFYSFLRSPSFNDADLVTMLSSFHDHARYLRANPTAGNWLTMEMSGLYTVGALFPEFREAADWREFAAKTLEAQQTYQFLPDGAQAELTPAYHNVALDNMLLLAEAAKTTGFANELPATYLDGLLKAFDYNLALCTPDRDVPRFNNSWPVGKAGLFQKAVRFFPDRADFRWILTDGKEGVPPLFTSRFLEWAGYAVMRSAWSKDANYLAFDVGPLGHGHVHQDKLNVVLWAWGREILFDSGGASYERSKWRDWGISTASHNCVLVDGLDQNVPQSNDSAERHREPASVSQQPIDAAWISSPVFDYAKGIYGNGYGPRRQKIASHERQVLFLKPDIFVVADELVPHDQLEHTYQARWHLLTTNTVHDPATGEVTTADTRLPNLAIVPLLTKGLTVRTASAEESPEILGWNLLKDKDPPLIPATTVLHTIKTSGNGHFLTLLLPLEAGKDSPVAKVVSDPDTQVHLNDGRILVISTAGGFAVQELLPDGSRGRNAEAF